MAGRRITNYTVNGKKYYRIRLLTGYDKDGKKVFKVFYGKSKTEAVNKLKEYEQQLKEGINPDLGAKKLHKAMYEWLWNIEKNSGNKSSTFERYESDFRNHIKESPIGQIPLLELKKIPIQKYYQELIEQKKNYSLISNINKILNKFFRYAVQEGYIHRNPLNGLKLPKEKETKLRKKKKEVETFSKEEINKLLKSLDNVKLKYIIYFALYTGTRQGEILSLEKSDIKDGFVKINKTVKRVKIFENKEKYKYKVIVTKPKTENAIREVPIPDVLEEQLKKLSILVKEEKLKLGPAYTDNNLLFPSLTGNFIDSRTLIRSWKRASEKANIKYRKFHALRHTYATKLFENDVSILTVARLLGHSSTKTTEIYTHVLDNIKKKEVECLNDMLK